MDTAQKPEPSQSLRTAPLIAALALSIGNLFMHKPISDGLDLLYSKIGRQWYELASLTGIGVLSLAAAATALRQLRATWDQTWVLLSLFGLAILTAAAQQWMLVTNIELIHFPQFALLAFMFLAAGLPPKVAWLTAFAGGLLDETYQHLVLYAGVPDTYFDINDILLNAIGAAWGACLFGATKLAAAGPIVTSKDDSIWSNRYTAPIVVATSLVAAALYFDPLNETLLRPAATRRLYRVLSTSEGIVGILMVAILVELASHPRRPRAGGAPGGARSQFIAVSLVTAIFGVACQTVQPPAEPVRFTPAKRGPTIADTFLTTFWCGPPLEAFDDSRAREIAAAGFNLVGAPCEGAVNPDLNRKALDIAKRHGLAMLIKDSRLSASRSLGKFWRISASKALLDYRGHESVGGFFLSDEPNSDRNPDIAALRNRIRRRDGDKIGYVNLLPDYVFPGPEDYREYVEAYLFDTQPDLLSYDHYPFLDDDSDRPSYFPNLLVIRELAIEYNVPFMAIIQLMPHANYRDVTYEELAWQAFHALAFGARGISYFAYWTPSSVPDNLAYRFRKGIIDGGLQTEHYAHVKRLNRELRALAAQMDGYHSESVWNSTGKFGGLHPPKPFTGTSVQAISIGTFASAANRRMALVVNQDYREPTTTKLMAERSIEVFDPITETWAPAGDSIKLAAGAAVLVRFR